MKVLNFHKITNNDLTIYRTDFGLLGTGASSCKISIVSWIGQYDIQFGQTCITLGLVSSRVKIVLKVKPFIMCKDSKPLEQSFLLQRHFRLLKAMV